MKGTANKSKALAADCIRRKRKVKLQITCKSAERQKNIVARTKASLKDQYEPLETTDSGRAFQTGATLTEKKLRQVSE